MSRYSYQYVSPIGTLELTASLEALYSIRFIDQDKPSENHGNEIIPLLETAVIQLNDYFSGRRKVFDLPYQLEGTLFQQKVWKALQEVPFGKTASYLELSKRVGDVKAIRAVGSANGKNKLPILIPCHRIIGSKQELTGYAGGLWRKQWLLNHEAKWHAGVQLLPF